MDSGGFIHTVREDHPIVTRGPVTGQNEPVALKKFVLDLHSSDEADAFVFVDLDDAETATGIVRSAKKILVDGARSLARSETYSWALMGQRVSGASAGINALDATRDAAVAAFWTTIATEVTGTDLRLRAGKGVPGDVDADSVRDQLLAQGVVAAATATLGGLDGRTIAVERTGPAVAAITALLGERGGNVEEVTADSLTGSTADALVCGSRLGMIDHETAALLDHRVVIPSGPSPLTARAFAVCRSRGTIVLPGFLTACGPLFAGPPFVGGDLTSAAATDDASTGVTDVSAQVTAVNQFVSDRCLEFADHPEGPFMAACYTAEDFLRSWREEPPFGRPLA